MKALLGVWRLLDARQRRRFALLQCVSIFMAFSTLGGIAALVPFLMVLADPDLVASNAALAYVYDAFGFASRDAFLAALGIGFVLAVLTSSVVNLLGTLAMTRFALAVGDEFHAALLGEYLRRDFLFHARTGSARLFNRVVYSVNRVASGLIESAMIFISNSVAILLIVGSILVVNPWVALIAIAWLGGAYFAVYALARRRLYRNGLRENDLIAARARFANESLDAIREVQVLGRQAFFRDGFAAACRAISRLVAANQAIAQAPRYALESMTVAGLVGVALVVSRDRGVAAWLAELTFLGFAAFRLLPAIQQVFSSVVRIRANEAMYDEIAADLGAAIAQRNLSAAPDPAMFRGAPRRDLSVEDVWFRHASDAPYALAGVSLRIPAGALVGIIGANGSGKTTLVEVLLGLLKPDRGRVLVDDVPLDAANRRAWQRTLSYAPQNVVVLDATLAENIAFGVPPGEIDRARLARAAQAARLEPLLATLPAGLDSPVGEGGLRLSGGQRQRLGIARALYRDASVLVLDEPTSSLDGLTEAELIEVLRALRGQCTVIVIAHRANVIRECDRVFELECGALRAQGNYEDVLRASPGLRVLAGRPAGLSTAHADVADAVADGRAAQGPP